MVPCELHGACDSRKHKRQPSSSPYVPIALPIFSAGVVRFSIVLPRMATIFRDTGLGCLFGVQSKIDRWDLESRSSGWMTSHNYALSLKLESARTPASFRCGGKETGRVKNQMLPGDNLSVASSRSDDTKTNPAKCAVAEYEMGWDGPEDPEVA